MRTALACAVLVLSAAAQPAPASAQGEGASAADAALQACVDYYNGGDAKFEKALELCNRAVALAPQSATAAAFRGFVYLEGGRYAEVVADLDRAVAAYPGDYRIVSVRGQAKARLGDAVGAAADFDAAERLAPAEARADIVKLRAKYLAAASAPPPPAAALDVKGWTRIGEEGGTTLLVRPHLFDDGTRGAVFRTEYATPVAEKIGDGETVRIRSKSVQFQLDCARRTMTLSYMGLYASPNLEDEVGYVWGWQTGAKPQPMDRLKAPEYAAVFDAACR
ncbi:hypothetical protein [Caulobacter sp. 17J65-9]|uniref:tetratricopeptide repeat protein n=1 Tax=Caulobacter sp. 17J65-9 TaxID=2709382 RepID=UPI0013CB3E5D|nr:hypothetical protein [Caulobacter sp. 17J65-9]NEX94695.1 hypothetical protein [Caulobacter sp. 17J65-9]